MRSRRHSSGQRLHQGEGNLIFQDHGKQAYTFFNRQSGKGVRVAIKNSFDVNKLEPKLALLRKKVSQGLPQPRKKRNYKL